MWCLTFVAHSILTTKTEALQNENVAGVSNTGNISDSFIKIIKKNAEIL